MNSTCLFCRIVSDTERAHVVYRDSAVMAILDIRPLFLGHTLVLPRTHHETLHELPAEALPHFFETIQALSSSVIQAMEAVGSFVAINNKVSQSVPHLHCHVVPRKPKDGLRGFFWPRTSYVDEDQMVEVADRIRRAHADGTRG